MAQNNTLSTNNSLSDLNNQGHQFNTMLKDSDINQAKQSNQGEGTVDNQVQTATALQEKVQSSANDTQKATIQTAVENNTNSVQTTTPAPDPFNSVHSLFDRSAYIDYARFILPNGNPATNWIEYKLNDQTQAPSVSNLFTVNNTRTINQPVFYKDGSLFPSTSINPDFSNEGLSLNNLITWSEKYPALQMRYQDFVYCKKLGYYPNNRLIVLRRFKGGVPDNLFDYYTSSSNVKYTQPLATMITWLEPDEEIMDMRFNENWEDHHDSFLNVLKNSKEKMIPKPVKKGSGGEPEPTISNTFEDLATALTLQQLLKTNVNLVKENGVPYTRSDIGNPNLVTEASKRKTNGEGLSSEIGFTVKFEYEMRYINKIDPGIAMLDLLSNAMRMGTSESEFRYNIPLLKNNDTIKALINGDIAKFTDSFSVDIKNLTQSLSNTLSSFIANNNTITTLSTASTASIGTAISGVATNALTYIISRYREDLKAALSADTGLPSGVWHISVGNPKSPFISCGDLLISSSKLKLGKELGYNDFPNSFVVEYELKSSRTRGRQEISRIFNAGRGRTYVYPQPKNNPDFDLY